MQRNEEVQTIIENEILPALSKLAGDRVFEVYPAARDEWTRDEYEDFFNADEKDRKMLLRRKGVPNFTGYGVMPGSADEADLALIYNTFKKLNELGKGIATGRLLEIAENPEYRAVFGKPDKVRRATK